ncbi:hypothetical protein, partial [Tateyamaria sp. syn59]|uniref:hypothetical protein n=1 Tax=Tateyamaria sp. syn59 TaxID=2576942 RepID=UPI001CB91F0B
VRSVTGGPRCGSPGLFSHYGLLEFLQLSALGSDFSLENAKSDIENVASGHRAYQRVGLISPSRKLED